MYQCHVLSEVVVQGEVDLDRPLQRLLPVDALQVEAKEEQVRTQNQKIHQ